MTETRHKTVIEVHADTEPAKRKAAELQAIFDRIASTAGGLVVGGAAGGGAAQPGAQPGQGAAGGGQPGARPGQRPGGGRDPVVRQTLVGQTAAQMIQSFGGGLPGMVAGSGMVLQGLTQRIGQQMMQSTNRVLQSLGQSFSGGLIGNIMGPLMALGGAGVGAAMQVANQRRQFNMTMNQVALTGTLGGRFQKQDEERGRANFFLGTGMGGSSDVGEFAQMGWDPQVASQVLLQWGQAKGTTAGTGPAGGDWRRALRVARSGANLGVAAAYQGLAAAGAGGRNVNVENQIALAQQQGMVGSGIDRWLSMIASNTRMMAQQGFDLNLSDHDNLVRSILGTEGMKTSGYRAIQAAGMLARQPVQARQQLLGGFAAVGPSAMLAAAAQGGGGIMDMVQRLQAMGADPNKVREAINSIYGPEVAALFYAQQGLPTTMATGLAGQLGKPVQPGAMRTWEPGELEKVRVTAQAKRISEISQAEAKNLIKAQEDLTNALVHVGGVFEGFIELIKSKGKQTREKVSSEYPNFGPADQLIDPFKW